MKSDSVSGVRPCPYIHSLRWSTNASSLERANRGSLSSKPQEWRRNSLLKMARSIGRCTCEGLPQSVPCQCLSPLTNTVASAGATIRTNAKYALKSGAISLVHAPQTKDASMYGSRRSSLRDASIDRMRCGIGEIEL
jgi:hypothetical protein